MIAAAILLCIGALVATLIFVTKKQREKRREQLRFDFNTLLSRHDLQATQVQEFEHRLLAIDTNQGVVAFVQDDISKPSAVVNLSDVSEIRIWKEGYRSGQTETAGGMRPDEHVASIGLAFSMRNGEREYLPLYSEILDGINERGALQKDAEEWLRRLQTVTTSSVKVHAR